MVVPYGPTEMLNKHIQQTWLPTCELGCHAEEQGETKGQKATTTRVEGDGTTHGVELHIAFIVQEITDKDLDVGCHNGFVGGDGNKLEQRKEEQRSATITVVRLSGLHDVR